ncbi:dTDP-4-dehydrorhamnose reductase [Massilia niabensis]|uniref:dTDP-4-dehydrorhamnose reductase n=1 Tax=Massilia niabensis TaxID=544910 RepID=A0ABW0L7C7_9BURK
MKILLTGKDGQVGFELQRALAPLASVTAVGRASCDLANEAALRALVRAVRPDVIVNAAAYTAVDKAESDQAEAFAVNTAAPRVLGEEAARAGALVLHFSTDYVFSGEQERPYTERDMPDPCNVYGLSKYQGELALRDACARHLVLRTSWVLGAHGRNFARTVLRLGRERDAFGVVADQHGAPTPAALLADLCAHLLRQYGQRQDLPFGTYHVAAGGTTTWYDYARFVLGQARASGKPLKAGPDGVRALDTQAYPTPAKRPRSSRLDTALFCTTFGLRLPPWEEGVQHVLQQILESDLW